MREKRVQKTKCARFKVPLVIYQGKGHQALELLLPLMGGLVLIDLSKGKGFIKPQQEYEVSIRRIEPPAEDESQNLHAKEHDTDE
jgi:hypothetical protein